LSEISPETGAGFQVSPYRVTEGRERRRCPAVARWPAPDRPRRRTTRPATSFAIPWFPRLPVERRGRPSHSTVGLASSAWWRACSSITGAATSPTRAHIHARFVPSSRDGAEADAAVHPWTNQRRVPAAGGREPARESAGRKRSEHRE
jgi:hypothetical protein